MESIDGVAFTPIAGLAGEGEDYDPGVMTVDKWFKRAVTSTMGTNACTRETNIIKVTVINFSPGSIGGEQTICENTAPSVFTSVAATGDGTKAYLWEYSLNNSDWFTAAGINTNATYTSPALTADTWFRRRVTASQGGTDCVDYTNTILVTVNNFEPGVVSAVQTICDGETPALFASDTDASGDGVITYQWQRSSDGTSYNNITGAESATYASGPLTADTWFRRQATSTLNGNQCIEWAAAIKVTVINFTPGSVSAAQTICEGIAPAQLTSTAPSGDGVFGVIWQQSSDGTAFSDIAGETGSTFNPPALAQDTWYRLRVESTLLGKTCELYTNSVRITVINFDPGSIDIDQTICENTAPVALTSVTPTGDGVFTYKWYSSTDGVTFGLPIPGAVSETYNPGVLAVDMWYYREVTSTLNGRTCIEPTNTVKITVNNFTAGSIKDAQFICDGSAAALLESDAAVVSEAGAVITYRWMESIDGVAFTPIAGLAGEGEDYDPGVMTADKWFKRAVTSTMGTNACTRETNIIKVTVINFDQGSINADQTICENTAPATFNSVSPTGDGAFTFLWEYSINNTDWFAAAGVNTSASYTSAALSVDTWFRRVVTATMSTTSCPKITNSVKVTINSLAPGISTADQTICESTAPSTFNSTPPTGSGVLTYQWQRSTDGVNFSNITGAIADSYTSAALAADTWFRLSVTSTLNGNSCTEMTNAIKVTVNNFDPGSISAAQTVCDGEGPALIGSVDPSGDGDTYGYVWQSSVDNIAWTPIVGATSNTYTPSALTQDTWFKRIVTSTLNGIPCVKETNPVRITVINFIPGTISAPQTICESSVPVPLTSVTPTGDGSFTYRWFSSTDGINFGLPIPGAVNETFAPGTLTQDTWYKREVTSTLNAKQCIAETNIVRISVNNFVPGTLSGDQTICEGTAPAAFTVTAPTGDGDTYGYQWKSSADGVNYLDISGATSDTYLPGVLNQDTWFKRVVISTLNGVPCTKETSTVKVTVNNVNAGTIISDQTICIGSDPISFFSVVHGSGDGAITFEWQSSTDGISFAPVAGADALNYDPPVIAVDTWYKRITRSLLSGVECSKESNVVKITVNTVNGGTISADQTICFGSSPAPFTSPDDGIGTGSTVTYQWLRSDNNVIFSTIPGATTTTYTPGVHYTDTYYKRTIISIQNGILCTAESNVIKVTVNPLPIAVLSGGASICPAENAILKVELLAGTGPFELDIENHGTVTGYTSNADIIVSPAVTTIYKLLRVRDANGCEIVSPSGSLIGTATVTVRALPAITTSPVNKTICEFGVTSFSVAATGSDISYQWFVDQGSGFNSITDGGIYFGATSSTLNLFGATRDMNGYIFHAVVSGCAISVTSTDATLTVNTVPEITLQPKDSTICMTGNATFSVTATGTSVTYNWQVNKGSGFASVVDDVNFSGQGTNTITITNAPGTFNNYIFRVIISGTCGVPVYSNFVVLRVFIPPVVTLNPVAKAICDGTGPVTFVANGSGQIDSLRWQVFSGGVWSDIYDNAVYSGTTSQQLSLNNIPLAYNSNQYRLGLKARCTTVYSNAATLTVNANPVVDFSAIDPVNACGGVPVVINGNPSGGSGTWSQHLWTGDVGPLNNYFIQSPAFKSQIPGTYVLNYRVRDNNGCYGNDDITVIVDAPNAEFTQTAMNGCMPLSVTFNKDMTGYPKFWWDFGDGSPKDSVNTDPVHIFTNTNPASIEYRNVKLTVRSAGGCLDTFTSTVTVYPAVVADFTANRNIVCSGSTITFTSAPGASKYFWEYGDGATGYSPTETTTHLFTNFTAAPVILTVKLTTTSFYNCTDEETMTVTVMPVPQPQFMAVPTTQIYSPSGNPVTFTDQTNPGSWTYLWKFGDGSTSNTQNPVHTYTTLGNFNVTLIVSNTNCSDSVKHEVRVLPIPPVANFDSIPANCAPLAITLNNTSLYTNTPGTTYRWDFGDGSISTAKNPTYTYFDPGSYRIELTVTGPGGTSTKSQVVRVYESPKAYFEVAPNYVFVNDEKVRMFNHTTPTIGLTYLWEFGDGDTAKTKEPFHRYMEEGVYDITLWAYMTHPDGKTCSDKFILSPGVTVEPAGEIRFSTVFTPNKDGEEDAQVDDMNAGNMDRFFYPPIREKVLNYKLQVFNRLGVLIFHSDNINKPWNGYYKGRLCPQGVYVWYVEGKYANGMPFKKVGDVTLLH
jgi:PKD repeat protein